MQLKLLISAFLFSSEVVIILGFLQFFATSGFAPFFTRINFLLFLHVLGAVKIFTPSRNFTEKIHPRISILFVVDT